MALIVAFLAVFAFGSITGGVIISWKDGAKMAALESRDAVVTAANAKCAKDVAAVQAGVKGVTDALDAKQKAAAAAMKDAQYWAAQHSRLAEEVNSLPVRPGETQCQAVEREQREYVQSRRANVGGE